jgi:hypothetical protein
MAVGVAESRFSTAMLSIVRISHVGDWRQIIDRVELVGEEKQSTAGRQAQAPSYTFITLDF